MNSNLRAPAVAGLAFVSALLLGACSSTPEPASQAAPPAPIPPRAYVEKLSADGLFAFGKSSLDDAVGGEALAELDALAAKLVERRPRAVHVIGHSDRIGSDKANLALSTRRAEAVRDRLAARGVQADVFTAVGRGSVEPVVECAGERGEALIACLAPNRRVEVRVGYAE
ncbi:OmpA family protein [Luteimonas saliphila]|uniref:OmpA family protein n=1 Tax=Luteimonas saliphila TaxID=2804919 RepID=UPI00192D4EFE|nr:OmpA family protein [Luteimonas saliphila]